MKREVFEKWDLLPLSHSKLSSFKHFPCQFIINKIYKLDTGDNPSMSAGRNVEKALYRYIVEGAKSKQDIISECIDQFVADMQPYEYDTNIIKKFCEDTIPKWITQAWSLTNKNYKLHSYQEKIETEILGIPFIGYTDFVFDLEDEMLIYDLKIKKQMRHSNSEVLQQLIYKKALEEKYNKPVSCYIFSCTPSKNEVREVQEEKNHWIEIHNNIKGLYTVLSKCNTPEELALMYQPVTDSWEWNDHNTQARKEIWGI